MAYASTGPKPVERASKAAHLHVVNDAAVLAELGRLYVPPRSTADDLKDRVVELVPERTGITDVVAIDGGYTEVPVREGYPSASIHFFQFGALHFSIEDLKTLERSRHISPEEMQKIRNIERLKFALATCNARRSDTACLRDSVRMSLYDFLCRERLGEEQSLMSTLAWLVFRRYKATKTPEDCLWVVGSHPLGLPSSFVLKEEAMTAEYKFPDLSGEILLCDAFRLHERIEEETGAAGIAGYVAGLIEHLILLHIIRFLLRKNSEALSQVLFIMDRPTGWFGVTAPMHGLMLELNGWLFEHHDLFLAGLEKSGAFVDHATSIREAMAPGQILVLDDEYIYKYISPGEEDPHRPYASTSYYGTKVIFKTRVGGMYVVSLPVAVRSKTPTAANIPNLQAILTHVEQLRCDMYENALLPVALANKLVSLSAHPSSQILKAFAKARVEQR